VPAALAAAPAAGRPVAVIGLSSSQADRIGAIGAAGGAVLFAVGERVTVAMPDDDGFVSRLRSQGYWLVLDAQSVPGCSRAPLPIRGFHVQQHS